jgi:hypothetical protein
VIRALTWSWVFTLLMWTLLKKRYLDVIEQTLHQLRCGKCIRLNSLLHKLGKADSNLCPECGLAVHTTLHLFEFSKFPLAPAS